MARKPRVVAAPEKVADVVPIRRKRRAATPTPEPVRAPVVLRTAKPVDTLLTSLTPHPRNYKKHPAEQLVHIEASLEQFGVYRNVVAARDGTILAGHGVVEAARRLGAASIQVVHLDLDPESAPALKLLALDNELGQFAEQDDRTLADILKVVNDADVNGLLGTGYDGESLAALLMNTRPASEIKDFDTAREWVGMPEYQPGEPALRLVITFSSEADRKRFVDEHEMRIDKFLGQTWSVRWPLVSLEDNASIRFEERGRPKRAARRR